MLESNAGKGTTFYGTKIVAILIELIENRYLLVILS